jgi:hypothetical protein
VNAWLIETDPPLGDVLYFCAIGDWCNNPNHAHKFTTQQEAEEVLARFQNPPSFRVAEHEWLEVDSARVRS